MSHRPPSEAPKDIAVRKGVVVDKAGQRNLLGDLYAPRGRRRGARRDCRGPRRWLATGRPEGVRGCLRRQAVGHQQTTVVGLITLFFRKYLARDAVAGVARKEARCLSSA